MAKPELELFDTSTIEWTPCPGPGNVKGLYERVVAWDPVTQIGTRFLKFEPGCDTSANGILTHEFWEELMILEGTLHDLTLNETFNKGMYACRPPGMKHGPWTAPEGCVTFEVRYYAHDQKLQK